MKHSILNVFDLDDNGIGHEDKEQIGAPEVCYTFSPEIENT